MIAGPVQQKSRVAPELLRATIVDLCRGRFLGRRVLAHLLGIPAIYFAVILSFIFVIIVYV